MSSFTTFAGLTIFALALLLLLLPRHRVARSNSIEPLKVRVITPKKASTVTTQVIAESPRRAPVPRVGSPVVGAQQLSNLSISDPIADVDNLISLFSSFSMKATLPKSCCKSYPVLAILCSLALYVLGFALCIRVAQRAVCWQLNDSLYERILTFHSPVKRPDRRTPRPRRVRFQDRMISEVHLIEISPTKFNTLRSGKSPHNLRAHTPGNTLFQFSQSVSPKEHLFHTSDSSSIF